MGGSSFLLRLTSDRQKNIVFLPLHFNTVSLDLGILGGHSPSCVAGDTGQTEKIFIGNLVVILQKLGTWALIE